MKQKTSVEVELRKIRKLYDRESVHKKVELLSKDTAVDLKYIKACAYDTNSFKGNIENPIGIAQIPLGICGPIKVQGSAANGDYWIPMATTEGALILTYDLGMRLLRTDAPILTKVTSNKIHITAMFPVQSDEDIRVEGFVKSNYEKVREAAEGKSCHTKLLNVESIRVADNFLLKFIYNTSDAQGLNMINEATFNACKYIESSTGCQFYHRSHYSGVKHHSLLNEKEGYGRTVYAKALISKRMLGMLKVDAVKMKDFFDRCIACGQSASISSVNVHAANAITALFIACGQDVADLSSSHVCSTKVELVNNKKDLEIETKIQNLLVATVGGGTGLGTQAECLKIMDCFGSNRADRFAELVAAVALSGEFPTAAAVINRTYVDIHNRYGRNKK